MCFAFLKRLRCVEFSTETRSACVAVHSYVYALDFKHSPVLYFSVFFSLCITYSKKKTTIYLLSI